MSGRRTSEASGGAEAETLLSELVERVRGGEVRAFDEIVRRFRRTALATAFALVKDSSLAQDVTQEAFVDAYRTLGKLRDPAAFAGWFRRIVFKHADRVRRRPPLPVTGLEGASAVRDGGPGPEDVVVAGEQGQLVRAALERLPEHERLVASLFYLGEQSHAEICDYLVLPLSTIKKRLHDARKHLREDLATLERLDRAPAPTLPSFEGAAARPAETSHPPKQEKTSVKIHSMTPLLNVRDVARSMELYTGALGFEVANSFEVEGRVRWAQLSNGPVQIMLNESDRAQSHADFHEARRARSGFVDCVLYIGVEDANALYERFQQDGYTTSEIFDAEYGMREFHMRDFDGYELAITSPL